MAVEVYTNGHLADENIMYFGNQFKGKGEVQFLYFRPNFTMSNTDQIESFIIGAIQDKSRFISNKVIVTSPYTGFSFDAAKEKVITKNGVYTMGVLGYLTDESALSLTFPNIKIEKRLNYIEAYKDYPLVYVVVIEVQ